MNYKQNRFSKLYRPFNATSYGGAAVRRCRSMAVRRCTKEQPFVDVLQNRYS